jgi:hypothetical protein
MYGIFGREITKYTVVYGIHIYGSGNPTQQYTRCSSFIPYSSTSAQEPPMYHHGHPFTPIPYKLVHTTHTHTHTPRTPKSHPHTHTHTQTHTYVTPTHACAYASRLTIWHPALGAHTPPPLAPAHVPPRHQQAHPPASSMAGVRVCVHVFVYARARAQLRMRTRRTEK